VARLSAEAFSGGRHPVWNSRKRRAHLRIVGFSGSADSTQRKPLILCDLLVDRTLLCELEAPSVDILGYS
jgi:hypothetical protein